MLKTFTKNDVLEKAAEYNVKFIRLQFTNIFGTLKNIAITIEELERALEGQISFDSSVIEGVVGQNEADILLYPDPSTFVIFPWRPREGAVARLICDVLNPDGKPFAGCSRSILKKNLALAEKLNMQFQVGAEIEFFLFQTDDTGKPTVTTHDQAGYCDLTPVDMGENARRDMVLTLQEMGFDVSSSHHEIAPGQHEIFLKDDDALAMADSITTFKFVVRTIAQRHGLHATFMPKPVSEYNGSGQHLLLSLWQNDSNLFYDESISEGLSKTAKQFIAGLLEHAGALTAVANPLVNSYKRISANDLAPILAGWSEGNRSTMIRVPSWRGPGTRAVLRSPDPAGNPYLVMSAALQFGLDGIKKSLVPPEPLAKDIPAWEIKKVIRQMGLPRNLEDALRAFRQDKTAWYALGEAISSRYLEEKENEWERFQSKVHPWELEEYLRNY
ncbi:L-glutamine synthetase [Desulfotomaculum arcticum]|uniref:L-glutamine synthetase n=1 Tax=Desulfotruncus arcticus DSM 17038 TaxID=1121424 RepID=A0A1I2N6R9_9FIRM|nr:glutamine synthetase family protein [Desulfotruncus arcticus]SFF98539.1 L-glutamine synthetase [Desulfotomaculum arcticum] [Desulfotruncus arcticus DSM 17038]